MAVSRNVTVDKGVASIGDGEYLAFRLTTPPNPVNPMFVFTCEDRRSILVVEDDPREEYLWYLGDVPANIDDGPNFSLDRGLGLRDRYVIDLLFAQCRGYRLEITKLPINDLRLDITYDSSSATDRYPETFTVIRS